MSAWLIVATVGWFGGSCPAQLAKPTKPSVAIVGGSVSAGLVWSRYRSFSPDQDPITYVERALRRSIEEQEFKLRTDSISISEALERVSSDSGPALHNRSAIFFYEPLGIINNQMRRALQWSESGLVVGLDLVFWFGYGDVALPKTRMKKGERLALRAEGRFALQAKCFKLLDKYLQKSEAVFVIGDYPDVSAAHPTLLRPEQRPTPATLKELNRRFHAFAAKRERIVVFPMHRLLASAVAHRCKVEVGGKTRMLRSADTLQLDEIHPNPVGVAVLVTELRKVVEAEVPEFADCLPEIPPFEKLLAELGIGMKDLDYLAGIQPPAPKPTKPKPETKPETKTETKPETKPETKTKTKPATKTKTKTETKPAPKPAPKTKVKGESQARRKSVGTD